MIKTGGAVVPGRAMAQRQRDALQAKERRARALVLAESGKTQVEIAQRMGVSRQRVYQMIRLARKEAAAMQED